MADAVFRKRGDKPSMRFNSATKRWHLFHASGGRFLDDGYTSPALAMNRLVDIAAQIWLERKEAYWPGSVPDHARRTGRWLGS